MNSRLGIFIGLLVVGTAGACCTALVASPLVLMGWNWGLVPAVGVKTIHPGEAICLALLIAGLRVAASYGTEAK